ncbi:PPE domain-containing protein, partial [Actinophytocola sediminis]
MTEPTQEPAALASAAEGARWRGHTHKQLYQMLHDGPGAAASAEPARRWQEIATNLSEIGQDLQKTLELTGARWTGKAAGGAYDRLSVTATWAAETSTDAAAMRAAVENQAEHLARARADMPAPEDVPATQPDQALTPAVQVAQAQADLEAPESSASSAEERAFEVMTTYEQSTNANASTMATFTPPLELHQRDEIRHGGGLHVHGTAPAGLDGWDKPRHDEHRPRPGGHHHNNWSPHTSGASAAWTEQGPRVPAAAQTSAGPAAPSMFGGGAALPLRRENDRERPKAPAAGNSVGAGPWNSAQPSAALP